MSDIRTTFNLTKGTAGQGVVQLLKKSEENNTIYTAFQKVKHDSFLEERIGAAIRKKYNLLQEIDGVIKSNEQSEIIKKSQTMKPTIQIDE